jgi:hypothetical protein
MLKEVHNTCCRFQLQQYYTSSISEGEPGTSVSIVSGYGLDDLAIKVRSPAKVKRVFPPTSVSRPALGPTHPPV